MANHKSALKRWRQNDKIRARNAGARSTCRTAIKVAQAAIEAGDKEAAKSAFLKAEKIIASASTKRLYHKNNASRKVSRLAKRLAALA